MVEKRGRGRPKKIEAQVKTEPKIKPEPKIEEEAPIKLPIKYLGSVFLKPDDPRFADIVVGSFIYDTKTKEATVDTSTFPPSWKQFETNFNVGMYTITDSKTGTEIKLNKTEDAEKWVKYIEEAEFSTVRGIYHIVGVNKVYEAQ